MNGQNQEQNYQQEEISEQKVKLPVWNVILIASLSMIAIGGVSCATYQYFTSGSISKPTACPTDTKICLGGSSVGRILPDCEFAPCPVSTNLTTDWQTYQNEEYGFEVKYPKDWDVWGYFGKDVWPAEKDEKYIIIDSKSDNDGPSFLDTHYWDNPKNMFNGPVFLEIHIWDNPKNLSPEEYENEIGLMPSMDIMNQRKLYINNLPAYEIFVLEYGDWLSRRIYISKNQFLFEIILSAKSDLENMHNQIFSTFKFIE